jgi:hypothetical protein
MKAFSPFYEFECWEVDGVLVNNMSTISEIHPVVVRNVWKYQKDMQPQKCIDHHSWTKEKAKGKHRK